MKILKKLLRIIGIFTLSVILFMLLLVVVAKIYEDKLASFTMEKLEDEISAPMSIGNVSLIPLFSFPRLSAEINDFWIGDPNSQNADTLFFIKSLKLSLDSRDLINGIYAISKLEISGLDFDYITDKNGKPNIDFLLKAFADTVPGTTNEKAAFPLDLSTEKFKIKNIHINYYDSLSLSGGQVFIPEIGIKAKVKNSVYSGKAKGGFVLSHCSFKETRIDQMESCAVNFDIRYENNKVRIKKLSIISEGINLGVKGVFSLGDTLSIDAGVEAKTLDFDILKKYVPKSYLEDYGIINIGGMMDFSAAIKGKYADSTLLPTLNADVAFRNIRLQTAAYPAIDTMNLRLKLNSGEKPDLSEAVTNIINLDIVSSKSHAHLEGKIDGFRKPRYRLSSNLDINLRELETFIPYSLAQNIEGNIAATIKTKGVLQQKIPDDYADYILENSTISVNVREVSAILSDSLKMEGFNAAMSFTSEKPGDKKITIDKLSLKSEALNLNLQNSSLSLMLSGKLADPGKLRADILSLRLQSGENQLIGSGKIKNLETPEFDIKSNIVIKLDDLKSFLPDTVIKNMAGLIELSIISKGKIHADSLDLQLFPLLFENSDLDIALKDVSLAFPDSIMDIDSVSARISLKNDILNIDDLSATYKGLKLEMDSSLIRNIYKAVVLNKNEELYVNTHIKIGDVIFDDFKQLMAIGPTKTGKETIPSNDTGTAAEARNWTFLVHGSATVKSFIVDSSTIEGFHINRLHINDISTLFKLTDSSYVVDKFKFRVFEGEMNNSLNYKIRDDGTQSVSVHSRIQNMNIRTLLRDMDNFGMDSLITSKNISGLLTTDLNTFIPIDDSVLIDKMMVSGDLTLEKGGVYNYAPARQIAKFTSIKELDNIQFKTLRSNIFMFKNKLYVPRTDIVSNAIDIAAFGMQSLDGDSEYHLELHLSNILFGKSKKRNKKQDKSGEEIDKGTLKKNSQKIKYVVKGDKSKVARDSREERDKMMNKIRVQKKMLDFIFFPKNIHYSTDSD
ncbi:MAG: AsmA family protein [Chlorobi bacterium]|nr:AsmA family protein [Chlorobiota bacterium]